MPHPSCGGGRGSELLGDIQVKEDVDLLNLVTFLRAFNPSKHELRGEVTSLDLICSWYGKQTSLSSAQVTSHCRRRMVRRVMMLTSTTDRNKDCLFG